MPRDSRQDNRLTATMSQRLAVLIPDYVELAGSDPIIAPFEWRPYGNMDHKPRNERYNQDWHSDATNNERDQG
jgi:hypothetical protein